MSFDDWWETVSVAEQKLISYNVAHFVWMEAVKHTVQVLTTPRFIVSGAEDRVIIMRSEGVAGGEGGMFSVDEFDEAVNEFFNKNF